MTPANTVRVPGPHRWNCTATLDLCADKEIEEEARR